MAKACHTVRCEEHYMDILLDDEVMNGRPAETTKEASLAARISDGKGGKGSKHGQRGPNKGRQQHRAPQPFDGYVYDGRRPSEEYVRSQKEKRGASYRECQFCTWPGHLANDCHKLKALKAKQGSKQNSTSQESSDIGPTSSTSSSGKFITWEASITELVASTTEMSSDNV